MPVDVNPERLLETFLALVRLNSPSGQEGPVRAYLQAWLDRLSIKHHTDAAGNLIAELPAYQAMHDHVLVLSGHMDVVPPCLNIQPQCLPQPDGDTLITSDGTTVLGADDKAALAVYLEALESCLIQQTPRPALRLLFTVQEETKLQGAKALNPADFVGDFAITMDHTGEQGTLIAAAPTYLEWQLTCKGKSVHAGIMPEKGISAIVFAANVLACLSQQNHLGRIDENTTANVGCIQGGKATNIVPDTVTLTGELRGHDPEKLKAEWATIEEILAEQKAAMPGADYVLTYTEAFTAYALNTKHPALGLITDVMEGLGLTPRFIRTNGGSDQNVFALKGLPGVVLSAGYVAPHALNEHVLLSDLLTAARLIGGILEQAAQRPFRQTAQ